MSPQRDPVVARRARIARFVRIAQRFGYGALMLAVLAFVAAVASDFDGTLTTLTMVALTTAIVTLPVPIVLGYGVRAAERDERGPRPGSS